MRICASRDFYTEHTENDTDKLPVYSLDNSITIYTVSQKKRAKFETG